MNPHKMVSYKIGTGKRYPHWAHCWHVDKWFRSWQAECDCGCLVWSARSWTPRMVERKAWKWKVTGTDIKKHEEKYGLKPKLWATLYIDRNMVF